MSTIRRLYIYLLAFAGLAMFAFASANLGQLLIDVLLRSHDGLDREYLRSTISRWGAAALVGMPVWLVHWQWFAQRSASNPVERMSTLRRVHIYATLAGAMIFIGTSAHDLIYRLLELVNRSESLADTLRPLPFLAVATAVWLTHQRIARLDRQRVGESGRSATLRRWYVYGSALAGLVVALSAAAGLIDTLWRMVVGVTAEGAAALDVSIAALLIGSAIWHLHWRGLRDFVPPEQDAHATLRGVYLFLALAVTVGGALSAASELLYYSVAHVLGMIVPGGGGGDLLHAAAAPTSGLLVYGAAWLYQRQIIRREAGSAERHVRVARLYTYLVALLALPVLAVGVAGMLWTLATLKLGLGSGGIAGGWPFDLALYVTMALVGLPVWLAHWGPRVGCTADADSLARRIYMYVTLILSTLALLSSAALLLNRLLDLALGAQANIGLLMDAAHALGVVTVAAGLAFYHWHVLRRDGVSSRIERSGVWISA